jgi:hypothetical protein
MLVVVCGPPGTGKTTVASRIADRAGGTLLRTDTVRKELVAQPSYTDRETERTYDALYDRARDRVANGEDVVLDGTFRRQRYRDRARELSADRDVAFELVRVTCPSPVVRERIAARDGDASDADFAVHLTVRDSFEPIERDHRRVDNGGSLARTRRQVDEFLRDEGLVDGADGGEKSVDGGDDPDADVDGSDPAA